MARGQPVTLNCKAEGSPPPRIDWFKEGLPLSAAAGPQRFFLHGSSLYFVEVIQNRKEDDAGVYWCEASNEHGTARSRNASLQIAGGSRSRWLLRLPSRWLLRRSWVTALPSEWFRGVRLDILKVNHGIDLSADFRRPSVPSKVGLMSIWL